MRAYLNQEKRETHAFSTQESCMDPCELDARLQVEWTFYDGFFVPLVAV